ncbi:recombination regulator RecX [Iodobacter sp. LRB]|uniref:recombination regulator RecX n=1 Tax=unclassified Iodobacter TaxID=235634 RepID=UPI000C0CA3E0|nr:recombination regulator RecX [Iodobacter sp. BJB302]PHV02242.1 recombination regulator RecX [Iodobacter sp. BJB302]
MTTVLRNKALQHLARRDHSRGELRLKLLPFADDPSEVDAVLDDFIERGWQSDTRFAEQWVFYRSQRYGPQRLRAELQQKGVSSDIISSVMEEHGNTELEQARALWRRKFGSPPKDPKEKNKQLRFLISRGFSVSVIYKVVGGEDEDY